jgi:UDPglucose 6-dehydrogenase
MPRRCKPSSDAIQAVSGAEVVWVTYDTPVDDEDQADVAFVVARVARLFPYLTSGTLVLISSQIPVGTTRHLEQAYAVAYPAQPVTFAYAPENLRLGRAIRTFTHPERVVVGIRCDADRAPGRLVPAAHRAN